MCWILKIPFEKGLIAHSDGDCLFHALAEALLGSLALGDLGTFFPDTDPKYESYDSELIAKNAISYIKTKFFHFLLGLKKITQHTSQAFYQLIPLQDFNEEWTDEKLYKKYGLTEDEINFIESMIRPME